MLKDFKMIREKLYSVISGNSVTLLGKMYSLIMIVAIVISLLPLAFKTQSNFMIVSDEITVSFLSLIIFCAGLQRILNIVSTPCFRLCGILFPLWQ